MSFKYDFYVLDSSIRDALKKDGDPAALKTIKAVDATIEAYQESLGKRAMGNLQELQKIFENPEGSPTVEDSGTPGSSNPPTVEDSKSPQRSYLATEAGSKESTMEYFREMVDSKKTRLRGSDSFFIKELPATEDGRPRSSMRPRDPETPVDPVSFSNLRETFRITEEDSKAIGGTSALCLEEDSQEAQDRAIKDTQSHLGRQMIEAIDMRILDDISKETYVLQGELNKLGEVKQATYLDIEGSLKAAEQALKAERRGQIIHILSNLAGIVPCDFYDLDPANQKTFRDAQLKLQAAIQLYKKADLNNENPGEGTAKNAVLDAFTLWPRFKEDARAVHLVDKMLEIEGI